MNSSLLVVLINDYARSQQHSVDHEQNLQARRSRVVCSHVNRAAPRQISAPCLTPPKPLLSEVLPQEYT
jgi:hypothetical protein